jgi:hypothetical protein
MYQPTQQRTRPAMHVQRNTEAYFRKHCCLGKAEFITHSECVSTALVIRQAKGMRRIILSSVVSLAHIFPHYLIKGTSFGKTLLNIKSYFDFLYKFCLKYFSI